MLSSSAIAKSIDESVLIRTSSSGGSGGSSSSSNSSRSSSETTFAKKNRSIRDILGDRSTQENAASALVGYVLGGFVVLPFDRIKTLLQVAAKDGRRESATSLLKRVVQTQGYRGLYQGSGPHFMIAPFTMFYYTIYGEFLALGKGHPLDPLWAAMCARTIETTLRMPLDMVRTQMQAAEGKLGIWSCVKDQFGKPPSVWFRSWLRGYAPTLLRDVPFSACYWLGYETYKKRLTVSEQLVASPGLRTFIQAYCCGALAGACAAVVTTPFDVIKTARQHHVEAERAPTYREILRVISQSPRAAFAGVVPRVLRVSLGLSVMMSGIEVTKLGFERRRQREVAGN